MAYTQLTIQEIDRDGLNLSTEAADGVNDGNVFDGSSERVFLFVDNGDASSHTVTIGPTRDIDGRTLPALAVDVPAGESRYIGPFDKDLYGQDDIALDGGGTLDDAITVTYDDVTSVTVAAVKLGTKGY